MSGGARAKTHGRRRAGVPKEQRGKAHTERAQSAAAAAGRGGGEKTAPPAAAAVGGTERLTLDRLLGRLEAEAHVLVEAGARLARRRLLGGLLEADVDAELLLVRALVLWCCFFGGGESEGRQQRVREARLGRRSEGRAGGGRRQRGALGDGQARSRGPGGEGSRARPRGGRGGRAEQKRGGRSLSPPARRERDAPAPPS